MNRHQEDRRQPCNSLPLRRWEIAALLVIVLGGMAIRMSYLSELARDPEFLTPGQDQVDMAFFDNYGRELAQRVRDMAGWAAPPQDTQSPARLVAWTQEPDEPFVRPPGYSFFVAFAYLVTGDNPLGLRAIQMAMGMASMLLSWWVARRLTGRLGGLLLAAFMSGYWTLIVYEGEIHAPSLVIFASLLALCALLRWQRTPNMVRAGAAGLALGAYALAASAAVLFLPVAACWMATVVRPRSRALLRTLWVSWLSLAALFGAVILPFTLANYLADGSFHLVSAGGGIVLLIGNHEGADGTYHHPEKELGFAYTGDHAAHLRALEQRLGEKPTWAKMSRYAGAKAVEFIRAHPGEFAWLTLKRSLLFWGPREISHNVMEYCAWKFSPTLRRLPGDFKALFALAAVGLAFLAAALMRWRRGSCAEDAPPQSCALLGIVLVLLLILVWYAPYTVFYATAHYRVPLLPFLGLFAVLGLLGVGQALHARRWKSMACVLLGVAVYAVSLMAPVSYEKDVERWYFYRITPHAERGDLEGALRASGRVVQSGINSSQAWLNHGDLLHRAGRNAEALAAFEAALRAGPQPDHLAETWEHVGSMRFAAGDKAGAEEAFRRTLSLAPADFEALSGLAQAVLDRGNPQEAAELLERAVAVRPDKSNTFFLLGLVRRQLGQPDAAAGAFRKGMSADPKDLWPVVGLASLLESQGRSEEAHAAYQKALELDAGNVQAKEGAARTESPR